MDMYWMYKSQYWWEDLYPRAIWGFLTEFAAVTPKG